MITTSYLTYEFRGLSTDDKTSLKNVTNGSVFIEMDTNKVFMYNKDDEEWIELVTTAAEKVL